MIKFDVKNRFSGELQFTAEIDCVEDKSASFKLGLAVKWAVKNKAVLRGAVLTGADLTGADLTGADLTYAVLTGADLTGADLTYAVLRGAVLTGADLTGADLTGAVLTGAVLTGADLRGVPKIKNIHQRVYQAASRDNALDMSDWHTCDTTHCRAGWVTTLAGEEGKKLEDKVGTANAAYLIYAASDPDHLSRDGAPDFYTSNENALADMKRLAELEASQ